MHLEKTKIYRISHNMGEFNNFAVVKCRNKMADLNLTSGDFQEIDHVEIEENGIVWTVIIIVGIYENMQVCKIII